MSGLTDIGHDGCAERRLRELTQLEQAAEPVDEPEALLRMLDDVVAERRVKPRDCRECKNFIRDESGLNFGWCDAHEQYVKLYHPPGGWYSQCLFKGIRRFKANEFERVQVAAELAELEGAA